MCSPGVFSSCDIFFAYFHVYSSLKVFVYKNGPIFVKKKKGSLFYRQVKNELCIDSFSPLLLDFKVLEQVVN